jgi:hypothetical protein
MSVNYFLSPLNKESADRYATRHGRPCPYAVGSSREATPNEVREVLKSLRGFRAEYTTHDTSAQVTIWGRDTSRPAGYLNLLNYKGDDSPCLLTFDHMEGQVMVKIAVGVAKKCGPQMLWDDTAGVEMPVGGDVSAAKALRELYRLLELLWQEMEE